MDSSLSNKTFSSFSQDNKDNGDGKDDKGDKSDNEDNQSDLDGMPPMNGYTRQKRNSWWNIFVPDNLKQR